MKVKFLVRIELDEEETKTLSLKECQDIEMDISEVVEEAILSHLEEPSESGFEASWISENENLNERFSDGEFDINVDSDNSAVCVVSNSETIVNELKLIKEKQDKQESVFDNFKSTSSIDPFLLKSIFDNEN